MDALQSFKRPYMPSWKSIKEQDTGGEVLQSGNMLQVSEMESFPKTNKNPGEFSRNLDGKTRNFGVTEAETLKKRTDKQRKRKSRQEKRERIFNKNQFF